MTAAKYTETLRRMPCFYCYRSEYRYIIGHHLKCIGAVRKTAHWSQIPVCNDHHIADSPYPSCHNFGISNDEQKEALMNTWLHVIDKLLDEGEAQELKKEWLDIDGKKLGEVMEWKAKGEAYWTAIGG